MIKRVYSGLFWKPLGEDYIQNFRKNIKAVTKEDVLRVAQKYLDPKNLRLVVVSKTDEVKSSLEPLGSLKVTSFLEYIDTCIRKGLDSRRLKKPPSGGF